MHNRHVGLLLPQTRLINPGADVYLSPLVREVGDARVPLMRAVAPPGNVMPAPALPPWLPAVHVDVPLRNLATYHIQTVHKTTSAQARLVLMLPVTIVSPPGVILQQESVTTLRAVKTIQDVPLVRCNAALALPLPQAQLQVRLLLKGFLGIWMAIPVLGGF